MARFQAHAGHRVNIWQVPETPELAAWIEQFRKVPPAHRLVDLADDKDLKESFGLAKEILERAYSLRCLLRRAGWAHDSPIWGFLHEELYPLRLALETLRMPIEDALRYVGDENSRLRDKGVPLTKYG